MHVRPVCCGLYPFWAFDRLCAPSIVYDSVSFVVAKVSSSTLANVHLRSEFSVASGVNSHMFSSASKPCPAQKSHVSSKREAYRYSRHAVRATRLCRLTLVMAHDS